jgi:hypothetical protein
MNLHDWLVLIAVYCSICGLSLWLASLILP